MVFVAIYHYTAGPQRTPREGGGEGKRERVKSWLFSFRKERAKGCLLEGGIYAERLGFRLDKIILALTNERGENIEAFSS